MEIKALVADSSDKVRKNIARSLQEIGVHGVVMATDGEQAMQFAKQDTFDVIITEWNTKTGAGEKLAKTLRTMNGNVPIIVTAPHTKKVADLKKDYPTASSFLSTPFTTEQLKKAVTEFIPSLAS